MTAPRRLVLATRNRHKLVELGRILAEGGLDDVDLVGADAIPGAPDVAETGVTFAANALLKATALAEFCGLPAVADDSGLSVEVMGGAPGIFSARWSGRHGDDRANLELLLGQLGDVPDEHRGAAFVCAAALVAPGRDPVVVEGRMPGRLVRQARGSNGFGYDPIFVPDGCALTSAELTDAEKDAISHRGKALRALLPHLREVITVS